MHQSFSEDFIQEFRDWHYISECQKLSEDFIRKFQDKVNWFWISIHQKLSEDFIREFQDKVDWDRISRNHKLSEDFIREFQDKVNWNHISRFQKLSEDFIREFEDKVNWYYISIYQKLSESFRDEFDIKIPKNSWLYTCYKDKLDYIKKHTDYELVDNDTAIIAYKSTRIDGHSVYNFQYKYEVGKVYEAHCDCNLDVKNSFGLSAWTRKGALDYHDRGKLFKVKIKIDDIGAIVHDNKKIRCTKLEVLERL